MNSSLKKLIRLVATVGVASSLTAIIAGRASATPPVLTDDAMIFGKGSNSQDSGSASCEGPGMFAGADGGLQIKRALVKFDVSGVTVPMGEHVEQVDLNLVIGQVAGSGGGGGGGGGCGVFCSYDPRYFSLHAVSTSKPWSQGTSGSTACSGHPCGSMGGTGQGWPHVAGDVTWASNIEGTSTWANNPTNQDYGSSINTLTYPGPYAIGDVTTWTGVGAADPFVTAVVAWMSNSANNNGLMIKSVYLEDDQASFLGWWTQEGATWSTPAQPTYWPELVVTTSP